MTTYYIGPSGNDTTGVGSSGNPWLTISKFNASSIAGDILICLPGTYAGASFGSVTFSAAKTIVGDDANTTIFDASGSAYVWHTDNVPVAISGITFKSIQNSGTNIWNARFGSGATFNFTSCIFDDLRDATGLGLWGCQTTAGAHSFLACLFRNCTDTANGGIVALFRNNVSGAMPVSIINCTLYTNLADGVTSKIVANVGGGTLPFTLKNNIFYNANGVNKGWVAFASDASSYIGSNNDIIGFTGAPSLTDNISADPLFVDAASGNFNLRPSSPAIDAGVIV